MIELQPSIRITRHDNSLISRQRQDEICDTIISGLRLVERTVPFIVSHIGFHYGYEIFVEFRGRDEIVVVNLPELVDTYFEEFPLQQNESFRFQQTDVTNGRGCRYHCCNFLWCIFTPWCCSTTNDELRGF